MQSPELPLLSPPSAPNAVGNADNNEEGPVPANELARISRQRQRQQNSFRALMKLVILVGFVILMILGIAIIVLGAVVQIQKQKEILLIMLRSPAEQSFVYALPEKENYLSTATKTRPTPTSSTVRVMLPKKILEKEIGSIDTAERII